MGWKFYDANGVESIAQLGTVAITAGGTGAINAGAALTALGVGTGNSPTFTNLTLSGNLTVSGSTTTIDTATLTVTDTLIKLNQAYTGTAYDIGLVFTRGNGSSTNIANRGFIWDESADEFSTIFCNTEAGTTAGNVTIDDYANLHVGKAIVDDTIELGHATANTLSASGGVLSIESAVVYSAGGTDVPVADGGTGASTLTDGGVLLGSGTGAVTAMSVLSDSEMIVGNGTTDPVAESGATLRTSIGVGTGDSPQFTAVNIGHASDTTITRTSAGVVTIGGNSLLTSAYGATKGFAVAMAVAL